MVDEAETVAATPDARETSGAVSGPLSTAGGSIATSLVMHSEEATRARAFFRLMLGLALLGAAFMPFVEGPTLFRAIAMAMCVSSAGLSTYTLRALRDEERYTARLVTVLGVTMAIVSEVGIYYFGLFSAAAMILPVGLYFFGLSESRTAARTTYAVGSVFFFLLSVGVILGLLPDLGPMPIHRFPVVWRWFFAVMTQVVFATTFFFARSSRRATEIAILRVQRTTRQLQQRDALLAEARGELERAQRPGEGRYTGQTIAGFRLGDVVGRGGMGEVYRAEREASKELYAVKLLHPTVLSDPDQVKRFVREAEIARKVASPYVARVIEAGVSPSGLPFVAMELLSGHDLAWHLRKSGKLTPSRVAELVDHASRALVAIREAGIVHRDLKPHNLILDEGEARAWKLLDFGVSRYEAAGNTLTQGALVGTPSYMAPEQVRMETVDHRTDLYALANVAYRALTGKPAFAGEDVATVLYHVVHTPPPQPSALVRLPLEVELVLAIAMAKAADDRFARVEEFAEAFKTAVRGELDKKTRDRGLRMVAKYPWSTADQLRAAG